MREKLLELRVAVLMGGTSREREVSLRSGKNVLASLLRQGFKAHGIDVNGEFVYRLRSEVFDIAFVCLHGRGGEDGAVQGLLEMAGIPYTGSGVLASAMATNKVAAKRAFVSEGLSTAPFKALDLHNGVDDEILDAERLLGYPMVLKPVSEGSSIGVSIIRDRGRFDDMVRRSAFLYGKLFVEKFIPGMEITVGVLGTNSRARALPVLELVSKNEFYDYEAKYTAGATDFILPARLSPEATYRCQSLALRAHRLLGCAGMSRVDMRVDADERPFLLEVNTIPGFTELSDLSQQARHADISFDELVFEILKNAYVDHEYLFHEPHPSEAVAGALHP